MAAGSTPMLVLVSAVLVLSCVHLGRSQCDIVRITAAVFETLQPLLNGIRSDIATLTEMASQQNETLRQLKERMASLEDNEPPNLTEMVSQQSKTLRHLIENELPSFKDMLRQQNETLRQLNDSVVSLVELDTTASVQLTSLEGQVSSNHLELTSKLESLCDMTIEDVSSELSDKIEESEKQITDRLLEIRQEMPVKGFTCGGTEGWRRVAYLDMTDLSTNCPSSWNITEHSKRSCGYFSRGCDSVFFSVSGGQYNRVCGRIRAYQSDVDVAFYGYNRLGYTTIDEPYFSGVAVMHGSPRQHIWTFAAGAWESNTELRYYIVCPCDPPYTTPTPPFVGEDYFCESGYVYPNYGFHSNDTLWDGKDCHSISTCCSLHSPPYFTKTLSETTTDDIELKTCNYFPGSIAIELIEIYVKQNYLQNELKEHDTQMKKSFVHQTNNINNLHVHTCGGTGDWRRAVYLDMTDPSTNCPSGWQQIAAIRACTGDRQRTCDSVFFPINGGPYSKVCGRIRAYQWGIPHAFTRGRGSIDDTYFSGVAVMHGNPRQHIWTFAAGAWENNTGQQSTTACPCDTTANITIPQFVGEDYFCESGYVYPGYNSRSLEYTFHSNDTLWDGKDCHSTSTCCSLHNPPYFTKTLNETTTDDLELRMCIEFNSVVIELIELYVK